MGKRKRSKIREFAEEELPEESKDHLPPLTRNSDEYAEKKVTNYVNILYLIISYLGCILFITFVAFISRAIKVKFSQK